MTSPTRPSAAVAAAMLAVALLLAGCGGPPPAPPSAAQAQAATVADRAAQAVQRGDWPQARVLSEQALSAAEALQDPALTGSALLNLALAQARTGDLPGALTRVDRVLADPARFDAPLRARAATRKALLLADQPGGDAAATALRSADEAVALCASPCALTATLDNLRAHLALRRGDAAGAAAAADFAARAAAAATGPTQATELATAWRLRGQALSRLGQDAPAARALAEALALDRQLGLPERIALDLVAAADHARSAGRRAEADAFDERAATVYAALGDTRRATALRARTLAR